MITSKNKFDSLESLIHEEGLHIEKLDIHPELDLLLVILNTKAILRQNISSHPRLSSATPEQLLKYQLIGKGTGVHWPEVDEDLSLKGFLKDELKNIVGYKANKVA